MQYIPVVYWVWDTTGCILGILANLTLLRALKATTCRSTREFERMVQAAAIFDIFFSFVELTTQHQVLVADGCMIMIPKGLERFVSRDLYPLFYTVHAFVCSMGVYILLAQYNYRYALLTRAGTSAHLFTRNLVLASAASLICGGILVWPVSLARENPPEHYLRKVDKYWATEGKRTYAYALDTAYPEAFYYFYFVGAITSIFFWSSMYYVYKILRVVHGSAEVTSQNTKKLQFQFTVVILIQGVTAILCSFTPISLVAILTILRVRDRNLGLFVMMPLSWLPTVNGLFSLLVIRTHREFVLSVLCCRKRSRKHDATTGSTVKPSIA